MLKPLRSVLAICFLLTAVISFAADHSSATPAVNIPFSFEINRGQTAPQVKYLARSPEGVLFFTDQGVTVSVPKVGVFRMLFDGASAPQIFAEQELAARSNYLTQKFGASITGVANYATLNTRMFIRAWMLGFTDKATILSMIFSCLPESILTRLRCVLKAWTMLHWLLPATWS